MTAAGGIPSWEAIADLLSQGAPVLVPLAVQPQAYLEVGPEGVSLGLLLPPTDDALVDVALTEVDINEVSRAGTIYVEVRTESRDLFRDFLSLVASILDSVYTAGLSVNAAIAQSIARWRDLVRAHPGLSHEAEIGLTGELWLLQRLINAEGPLAATAWIEDVHDFRRGPTEIEVKTTASEGRVHTINRPGQLEASPGKTLWLLSIQIKRTDGAGGDVLFIPAMLAWVQSRLATEPHLWQDIRAKLARNWNYTADTGAMLTTGFVLRSAPRLISASDESLPRITNDALGSLLGSRLARIRSVSYSIAVDGLGVEDGSDVFLSVIPGGIR